MSSESTKLRGLLATAMRGWVGGVCWNFGVDGVGKKNEVRQENGMALNALLFNHTL